MIHNKCSKFLHLNHRWSDHGLSYTFKDTGAVANGLTATKNTFVKCFFIFNRRWIGYGFGFSHRQKCNGLRSTRCKLCLENLSVCEHRVFWYKVSSLFWCEKLTHEFASAFKVHPVYMTYTQRNPNFLRKILMFWNKPYSGILCQFRRLNGKYIYIYIYIYIYTGCPRRNVPNFGRVFPMLNYTDITQNTYIQSWTVTEVMAREVWNFDSCYSLIDYQIHIETGRNMWFL